MVQKALALDETNSIANAFMGRVYLFRKQYDPARAEAEKAITLDPKNPQTHFIMSLIYSCTGKPAEAIEMAQKTEALDAVNPATAKPIISRAYYAAGRYEEALEILKGLNRTPHWAAVLDHVTRVILYSELNREQEAKAEAAEVLKLVPNFSVDIWRERWQYKDPAQTERELVALRKAGLK